MGAHLGRRQRRREKIRQRRSLTASRSKRSSTKRQPRAPRWPTRTISFICAKQTSSLRLIRRRSKCRRSCFMRRMISYSMSRSSKRRCERLSRPTAQLKALRCRHRTVISTACSQSSRRAIKSRRFWHGNHAAQSITLMIKNAGPNGPARCLYCSVEPPAMPSPSPLHPRFSSAEFRASGTS